MILYHGSPRLFDRFDLSFCGDGTGIKFGFGVYLAEPEASAVNYSDPREGKEKQAVPNYPDHYLYTVEMPDLTPDNHIVSNKPVHPDIIRRASEKLGVDIPAQFCNEGVHFRKLVGCLALGIEVDMAKDGDKAVENELKKRMEGRKFAVEKAAAGFLDGIGVFCHVWPALSWAKDTPIKAAVFNDRNVRIVKTEKIEIALKGKDWVLTGRKEI